VKIQKIYSLRQILSSALSSDPLEIKHWVVMIGRHIFLGGIYAFMHVSVPIHSFVLDLEPNTHFYQEYIDAVNQKNEGDYIPSFGEWMREQETRDSESISNAWDRVCGGWNNSNDSPDRDTGGNGHLNMGD